MAEKMTGGCACGRVRYSVCVENDDAYLCHCRMCQRATGGVSIAFKNVKKANVAWEHEPDWYASSPIARRPYCRDCGTPLGFAFGYHWQKEEGMLMLATPPGAPVPAPAAAEQMPVLRALPVTPEEEAQENRVRE